MTRKRPVNGRGEYDTPESRIVAKWPDEKLLAITPEREKRARVWLGAANNEGSERVVEHFVACVERCKEADNNE